MSRLTTLATSGALAPSKAWGWWSEAWGKRFPTPHCHCERSACPERGVGKAISLPRGDCFVAALLAMTPLATATLATSGAWGWWSVAERICPCSLRSTVHPPPSRGLLRRRSLPQAQCGGWLAMTSLQQSRLLCYARHDESNRFLCFGGGCEFFNRSPVITASDRD